MAELHFAPGQNYDCVMCAKGCVEKWDIAVDPRAAQAVRGSQLELRIIQDHGGPPFEVFPETLQGRLVGRKSDNRCVFLAADKLCEIHREMGFESKPIPCQQFPYTAIGTPDGIFVGVTFFCTSAQQNSGRPLPDHEAQVRQILSNIKVPRIGFRPLKVVEGVTMEWEVYLSLEKQIAAAFATLGPLRAFAKAFRTVSKALVQVGEGEIGQDLLERLWAGTEATDFSQEPLLAYQMEFFLGALLGVTEVGSDVEHQAICQAYVEGARYRMPRLGCEVDFGAARAYDGEIQKQFTADIHRYLASLLHRKFLVATRTILDNLIFGYLLQRFLVVYTALYAQLRNFSGLAQQQDFFKALDLLEADVVTHARGLEKLFAVYSEATHRYLCLA